MAHKRRAPHDHLTYNVRRKIAKRASVLARYNGRCLYCDRVLDGSSDASVPTLDHLIPLASGGRSVVANLVPACQACNHLKADSPISELPGPMREMAIRKIAERYGRRPRVQENPTPE